MKPAYRAALMVAAVVLSFPLSAHADIRAGSFEGGPFGGYNVFENGQNLKDSPVVGGRLGYNFTKHFGTEGVVEFTRSRVDDRGKTGVKEGQYRSPKDRVDLTFYHIDALYHFMPDNKFTPFVVAGFGGAHYSPDISTKDMAAFNIGIGVKYWLTDKLAFRADLRDYMVTEVFQETYHNVAVTVGITYAFGGMTNAGPAIEAKEPVVILVSEPKVEEKAIVLASGPKTEEKVIILALEDIHFDFDKSTLNKEARVILKKNIRILKENPKAKIRIAGYTSASGTEEYNQKLSERRATAVTDYLIEEGVVLPDRLSKIGYGETDPATYEAAPKDLYSTAAKSNMRVLFEIIVK